MAELVGDAALPKDPAPLTKVHAPVPEVAVLAARVKTLLQFVWSGPAADVVGGGRLVSDTFPLFDPQLPLVTVHFNTAVVPTGTPVISEYGLPEAMMVAVPDTIVQLPLPGYGSLPFM